MNLNYGIDCECCGGSGVVEVTNSSLVTRDMALDAGIPELEGYRMDSADFEYCEQCEGEGIFCPHCGMPGGRNDGDHLKCQECGGRFWRRVELS